MSVSAFLLAEQRGSVALELDAKTLSICNCFPKSTPKAIEIMGIIQIVNEFKIKPGYLRIIVDLKDWIIVQVSGAPDNLSVFIEKEAY